MRRCRGDIINIYQVPNHKSHLLAIHIIFHLPLIFISPTSQNFAALFALFFVFLFLVRSIFLFAILLAYFVVMASSSSISCTPKNEVLNFKQRGGENLKDAWYRICNAHNRSIRKQSTIIILRSFYVGITTWYRFILDTITGGNFLMCPSLDDFNAMGDLAGAPPIIINETILTLEHVMQRLDAIEKKMVTLEQIENLDKNMQNLANKFGSKEGDVFKLLR